MRGHSRDLLCHKSPLQQSFDASNPEYNRYSRVHFNSALLVKRRDENGQRKSTSSRLLNTRDKMFSMTFLNLSNRTLSKKIQRNIDDANLFSDDRFKRSEVLIPRKKVEISSIPIILTNRSFNPPVPKQDPLPNHDRVELFTVKPRKQSSKKPQRDPQQEPEYQKIVRLQKLKAPQSINQNISKKPTETPTGDKIRVNDLNRWEKEQNGAGLTTIEQYLAEKVNEPARKIKRSNPRKISK